MQVNVPLKWTQFELGGEIFWSHRCGPALVVFGLGPRHRSSSRALRLEAVRTYLGLLELCDLQQVHGCRIVHQAGPVWTSPPEEADGHVSRDNRIGLAVWTADCVPVLMTSQTWVGAVHSGWRGTAAGIVPEAIQGLVSKGVHRNDVRVFIGPAIGPCHYPVGEEVRVALGASGIDPAAWNRPPAVDLRSLIAAQVRALGVASVEIVGPCTVCDERMASFRRDADRAGRQLSLVARCDP